MNKFDIWGGNFIANNIGFFVNKLFELFIIKNEFVGKIINSILFLSLFVLQMFQFNIYLRGKHGF